MEAMMRMTLLVLASVLAIVASPVLAQENLCPDGTSVTQSSAVKNCYVCGFGNGNLYGIRLDGDPTIYFAYVGGKCPKFRDNPRLGRVGYARYDKGIFFLPTNPPLKVKEVNGRAFIVP
jgi:hypothetical protein